MSPLASPLGPPATGPVASGRRRVPLWLIAGGAVLLAAVVVVAAVAVMVAAREPSPEANGPDGQTLLRAPVQPMPPQGPELSTIPSECGVSSAVLDRVVPKRRDQDPSAVGSPLLCSWLSGPGGESLQLSVEIGIHDDTTTGPAGIFKHAVKALTAGAPLKVVTHLGDETYAHYREEDQSGYATIVMRAGNTVTNVSYSGFRDPRDPHALPESRLMPSALRVAREVARGLRVPVTEEPTITNIPQGQPAVSARSAACAAVSKKTQQRLLNRPPSSPENTGSVDFMFAPVHDSPRIDACYWPGKSARLRVETMTLADPPEGASAQAIRTLDWLQRAIRKEGISSISRPGIRTTLFALAGRGDGAFAAYEPPDSEHEGGQGLVAFRIHNAVIKVTYEGTDIPVTEEDKPLPQDQAINGAYTAATEVAATFAP